MKKNKDLKNLINKIQNEHDQETMAQNFELIGEKKLSDFVRTAAGLKNNIEPDRSLLLEILNDISIKESSQKPEVEIPIVTKVGLQMHMGKILKIAIPAALVVLLGIGIVANPFKNEKSQVAALKDISKEEKTVDQANSNLKSYLNQQKGVVAAASGIGAPAFPSSESLLSSSTTPVPFDTIAIANEADSLNYDPGLARIISQEKAMSVVDATLANF